MPEPTISFRLTNKGDDKITAFELSKTIFGTSAQVLVNWCHERLGQSSSIALQEFVTITRSHQLLELEQSDYRGTMEGGSLNQRTQEEERLKVRNDKTTFWDKQRTKISDPISVSVFDRLRTTMDALEKVVTHIGRLSCKKVVLEKVKDTVRELYSSGLFKAKHRDLLVLTKLTGLDADIGKDYRSLAPLMRDVDDLSQSLATLNELARSLTMQKTETGMKMDDSRSSQSKAKDKALSGSEHLKTTSEIKTKPVEARSAFD